MVLQYQLVYGLDQRIVTTANIANILDFNALLVDCGPVLAEQLFIERIRLVSPITFLYVSTLNNNNSC